jgi:hypothetical protein
VGCDSIIGAQVDKATDDGGFLAFDRKPARVGSAQRPVELAADDQPAINTQWTF